MTRENRNRRTPGRTRTAGRGLPTACLLAALLGAGSIAAAQSQPATAAGPVPLGVDTTRITEPLLPDGRPDYIGHWDAQLSAGVEPEKNFWVALVGVVGDRAVPEVTRRDCLRRLGVDAADVRDLYRPASKAPAFREAMNICLSGPWQRGDYPDVADWVQRNHAAIAALLEASRRSEYYVPVTTIGTDFRVLGLQITPAQGLTEISQVTLCRVHLALAENRFDDAVEDLLGLYRIGALLERDPVMTGKIAAAAFALGSDRLAQQTLEAGDVPVETIRKLLDSLPECTLQNALAEVLDTGGRFAVLDTAVAMAADPDAADALVERLKRGRAQDPRAEALGQFLSRGLLEKTDWKSVLVRANEFHDSYVQALQVPTFSWRKNALETVDEELRAIQREASILPWDKGESHLASRQSGVNAPTRWMGAFLIALMRSDLSGPNQLMDRAVTGRQLTRVAAALALHQAENGRFPDTLSALTPDYLAEVPRDYFTGRALAYDLTEGAYELYSVGPNGRDDGGAGPEEGGDDVVVYGHSGAPD